MGRSLRRYVLRDHFFSLVRKGALCIQILQYSLQTRRKYKEQIYVFKLVIIMLKQNCVPALLDE